MVEPIQSWKFWHPLPFWQAFVIAAVAQVVCQLAVVALDKSGVVSLPIWVGSGLGGVTMFLAIRFFATRRQAAERRLNPADRA